MRNSRRRMLSLLPILALGVIHSDFAHAQDYPRGSVRLVVGFAAGNAPDIVARLIGEQLFARLGQPVIVENRVGAASAIAAQAVASASPDGQTILLITPANAINPNLSSGGTVLGDIAPVATIARGPMVVAVSPSFSVKSIPDLVRFTKATPDKVIIGTTGKGTTPYLSAVLFKMLANVDPLLVSFGGSSQAVTELLGERVQAVFVDMSAIEFIKSGKLRALAVTSTQPQQLLPGIPTIGETLQRYEASTWYGIGAPKGTPPAIVERINAEIREALKDDKIKARLASMGLESMPGTSSELGRLMISETEKWAKVSKFASTK